MCCYMQFCLSGSTVTEPCWHFLVGASFGLGWQRRCGERDCLSIWPSASTSSHSCRYWRTVLTPALPSIHHSFPFMPPSASHLQTLESFLLILMACLPLPPSVNIHGKQTKWSYNSSFSATHTWMEQDIELQTSSNFWLVLVHKSSSLPVSSQFTFSLFILSLWSSWIYSAHPFGSLPFNRLISSQGI